MAFFDTLKSYGKAQIQRQFPGLSIGLSALSNVKKALQQPASPALPSFPKDIPQDGSMPQMGPMSMPNTPVSSSSFGAPVMPQVKAPTWEPPIVPPSTGPTFKSGLSQAQLQSLQTLATKPQEQWTATDKANWAYGTNNRAMPTQTPRPPMPEIGGTEGATAPLIQEQPKPEAPQAPALPPDASPETKKAVEASQALYEKSLQVSPEELSTQGDIDKLLESARKGFVNAQNQAIPMEFITGQLKTIEDRANALAEPLQARLARLQAQRTSAITASKFALERVDAKAAAEKAQAENKMAAESAQAERLRQEQLAASKPIEVGGSIVKLNPKTGQYEVLYTAPDKTASSAGFSLNPGESRYDAAGNLIASAPAKPTDQNKPLSGDAAKVLTIAQTMVPEIQRLKEAFNNDYKGAILGISTGTNRELSKLVDNIADKIGRLRSGGAINKDEEARFKNQIVSLKDLAFGDSAGAIKALDALITEANSVASGIRGGASIQNDPLGLGFNQESQTSKKGPLASNRPNPSKVIQTSTGTYDFSTYATDPNWGNAVKSHISRIPQLNTPQDITAFIRSQAPNSPITGDMVIASARKFNVDPKLILAIAKQEANYATLGRAARTFNPGNVGNVDSGANVNWGSWQAGLDALARNVSRRITSNQA